VRPTSILLKGCEVQEMGNAFRRMAGGRYNMPLRQWFLRGLGALGAAVAVAGQRLAACAAKTGCV